MVRVCSDVAVSRLCCPDFVPLIMDSLSFFAECLVLAPLLLLSLVLIVVDSLSFSFEWSPSAGAEVLLQS